MKLGEEESAVFADQHVVEPDFTAAAFGRLTEHEVPMYRADIAVVGVVVAAAGGEVDGSRDLLVEKDVADRLLDIGIEPEREFAHEARALVRVENLIRFESVVGGRLRDLAVLEDEAHVLELDPVLDGGNVIVDHAVHAVFDGSGIDLAVGDIALALALDRADPFDREGQVGVFRHDAHLVRPVHQLHEGRHRLAHLLIVETADVEVEILVCLGAHARELAHAFGRVAQDHPLGLFYPEFVVDGVGVILGIGLHRFAVRIRELVAVFAAANADICLHILHFHLVVFRHALEELDVAAFQNLAFDLIVAERDEGISARRKDLRNEQIDELIGHAGRLDEDVLPGLHFAGVIHQIFRQEFLPFIDDHTCLRFGFFPRKLRFIR